MTPETMAALHRRADAASRHWSAAEYAQLSTAENGLLVSGNHGFVLGQLSLSEAEIFMIIVDPTHQRRGLGLVYLSRFETKAHSAGATRVFLEVAASNQPAQALYKRAGYQRVGTRKNYYKAPEAQPEDALVLQKVIA